MNTAPAQPSKRADKLVKGDRVLFSDRVRTVRGARLRRSTGEALIVFSDSNAPLVYERFSNVPLAV